MVGSPTTFPIHGRSSKTCQSKQKGCICLTLAGDAGESGGEERSGECGYDLKGSCFPPNTAVSLVSLAAILGDALATASVHLPPGTTE